MQAVTKRQAKERADARHMVAQSTLDAFLIRPHDPAPDPGSHPRAARKPRRALKQLYLSSPEAGAGGSGASQGGLSATSEQAAPARAAAPGRQAELQLQVDLHQRDPPPDPETCTRAASERPERGRRLQLPARRAAAKAAQPQGKPSAACGDAGDEPVVAGAAGRAVANPMCVDLTASSPEAGLSASKRPATQCSGGGKDAVGMQPGFDRFRFGSDGGHAGADGQSGAALPSEPAAREVRPRKRARA